MLAWTIYITFIGVLVLMLLPRDNARAARIVALLTAIAGCAVAFVGAIQQANPGEVTTIVKVPWIPSIGANYYLSDKVFDTMKDARGWRLHFTRWYPLQRVLVDYFRKPGLDVASDVEQKIRHLRAHNEKSPDAKIGYVPLYAGDIPDTNTLVAACDGVVFDLPLRAPAGRF